MSSWVKGREGTRVQSRGGRRSQGGAHHTFSIYYPRRFTRRQAGLSARPAVLLHGTRLSMTIIFFIITLLISNIQLIK